MAYGPQYNMQKHMKEPPRATAFGEGRGAWDPQHNQKPHASKTRALKPQQSPSSPEQPEPTITWKSQFLIVASGSRLIQKQNQIKKQNKTNL